MIFDTHAHYDDEDFDEDRDFLLNYLPGRNIQYVVNVGANRSSTERTLALTKKYDYIYGSAGIHPCDTAEFETGESGPPIVDLDWVRNMAEQPKMLAIGEIGLDYYWKEPEASIQKKWFDAQLSLARELKKPVIIHSRDAAGDTLEMIRSAGGKEMEMVIHCFSYGVEIAREYLNMGHYLGVGGVVTFANAKKLKEVVAYMPLDRLLLETDCPYLTPAPFRGKRNSSLYLPNIVDAIAKLRGISVEEVEAVTMENAERFYRIG